MDQDTITWTGARAPGVERHKPLARKCTSALRPPTQNGAEMQQAVCTKDGRKPADAKNLA
jgi:hypothetical protein